MKESVEKTPMRFQKRDGDILQIIQDYGGVMAKRDQQGRTREQARAAEAARLVATLASDPEDRVKAAYNSIAGALPVMIRTNGILQVVAFFEDKAARREDKGEKPKAAAARLVISHLTEQLRLGGHLPQGKELRDHLVSVAYPVYLRTQEEALACATWHKRFAHASFGAPTDQD